MCQWEWLLGDIISVADPQCPNPCSKSTVLCPSDTLRERAFSHSELSARFKFSFAGSKLVKIDIDPQRVER